MSETEKPSKISPIVLIFEDERGVVCHINPPQGSTHGEFALLVCDLVRHIARAYQVEEADVWEWVDRERHHPTTDITNPN